MFYSLFEQIASAKAPGQGIGETIGCSREGREISGYRFGVGDFLVSLIGGCHADEPVGPALLRRLVHYLSELDPETVLLKDYQWWVIPQINPDGEFRNATWYDEQELAVDPIKYLMSVVRELPGDDIEFGFPRGEEDFGARPENMAAFRWWQQAKHPFRLHASLHGMAFARGPWFLVESEWTSRIALLKERCKRAVAELGYRLHDVDRRGEKGFHRIEEGFCTRPDSKAMAAFFLEQGDPTTAELFRPSSMEVIRSFGGDPLTLVSEIPLFVVNEGKVDPNSRDREGTVSKQPPARESVKFRDRGSNRLNKLQSRNLTAQKETDIRKHAREETEWTEWMKNWQKLFESETGREQTVSKMKEAFEQSRIEAMPIVYQMKLQWVFICAGIEQVLQLIQNSSVQSPQ